MLRICGKDKPLTFLSVCIVLQRVEQIDIQNGVKPSTCIPRKGKLILTVFISIFGDVIKFIVFTLSDPFRMLQALGEQAFATELAKGSPSNSN